ncbi:MAG: hypothetical protein EOM90_06190 [Alphaproteobacteria bacterium]|nr:hypothetical protein [Alphaproteobacteria bacterium]
MRKLSLIFLGLGVFVYAFASLISESPHGKGFSYACSLCHSSKGWHLDKEIYAFDHNKTAFPLTGQHRSVNCRQCHATLVFSEATVECAGCHTDVHNQTVGPDCQRCHTADSWIINNITVIHQRSRFPLLGPHYTTDCSVCHKSASLLDFQPLGVTCFDCHSDDYYATTGPDHVKGNYPTNCAECHSVSKFDWTGAVPDHSFFPLTEGHAISDCNKCHPGGNFANTPRACEACHQAAYNATTNPNHAAAQIPVTCGDCHTTIPGWRPATFAIHNNYYPLVGAHATIANECIRCHNNNYTNTPNTCVGCHLNDYNQTTNPSHAVAQFPTDCPACHNQNSWIPSTFNHDGQYFPIYSGKHRGEWTLCSECHTNPSNYQTFSCIDCHEHNKQDMDDEHQDVGGYSYNSQACFQCHPTGSGGKLKPARSNKKME